MSGIYNFSKAAAAVSLTNDSATIVAASGKHLRLMIAAGKGAGTASAANSIQIARSTGGVTPGGAITPANIDPGGASAGFSVYTTWGTQPTLASGSPLWRLNVNANGGFDEFRAGPGGEIFIPGGTQLSLRSELGTSLIGFDFQIEEIG
jgi:hypothetical protein